MSNTIYLTTFELPLYDAMQIPGGYYSTLEAAIQGATEYQWHNLPKGFTVKQGYSEDRYINFVVMDDEGKKSQIHGSVKIIGIDLIE